MGGATKGRDVVPDATESSAPREGLSRTRVLRAAVDYADANGIESLTMRTLAAELGVVPMALYKHVANKDDLLDGMVEVIVGEIGPTPASGHWKPDVRRRILAARAALLRHRWSQAVLESRAAMTAPMLGYLDSLVGLFVSGGLPIDLTHSVMHALGNRMWGFGEDLFAATPPSETESFNAQKDALPARFPNLAAIAAAAIHVDPESGRLTGCDSQAEFEFALDLVLDGVERLDVRDGKEG
jgi:AcrR family transcriptional regulator